MTHYLQSRVAAEGQLRAALTGSTSLEQRLRAQRLLTRELPEYAMSAAQRRRLHRLVFLLEIKGDDQARDLLQNLATGHPDRQVTQAARSALRRIAEH